MGKLVLLIAAASLAVLCLRIHRLFQDEDDREEADGWRVLSDGEDVIADICFVHGFAGWEKSWTAHDTEIGRKVVWPLDLLPKEHYSGGRAVRILSYRYDTNAPNARYLTQRTLYHYATHFLRRLGKMRKDMQRPLIFVGHDLGGILIQSALIFAREQQDEKEKRAIYLSTAGVVFFAVPNLGSTRDPEPTLSYGLEKIVRYLLGDGSAVLQDLKKQAYLLQLNLEPWMAIRNCICIKAFYEGKSSHPFGKVVAGSPVPNNHYILSDRDYSRLTQFTRANESSYRKVANAIISLCSEAGHRVQCKWADYERPQAPTTNSLNSFIVPFDIPIWIDKAFAKEDDELQRLDGFIRKTSADTDRHSTVVLYGSNRIGKTQLAMAYAHEFKDHFSSVIWISAETKESIENSYLNVAKRLLSTAASQESRSTAARIIGLTSIPAKISKPELRKVVKGIIEWLECPNNDNWLIVLDDLILIEDSDLELRRLIPVTTQSRGHLIVTSRHRLNLPAAKHVEIRRKSTQASRQKSANSKYTEQEEELIEIKKLKEKYYLDLSGEKPGPPSPSLKRAPETHSPEGLIFDICYFSGSQAVPVLLFTDGTSVLKPYDSGDINRAIRSLTSEHLLFQINGNKDLAVQPDRWRNTIKRDSGRQRHAVQAGLEMISSFSRSKVDAFLTLDQWNVEKKLAKIILVFSMALRNILSEFKDNVMTWEVDWRSLANICRRHGIFATEKYMITLQLQHESFRNRAAVSTKHWLDEIRCLKNRDGRAKPLFKRLLENLDSPEARNILAEPEEIYRCVSHLRSRDRIGALKTVMCVQEHRLSPADNPTIESLEELSRRLVEQDHYEEAKPKVLRLLISYETKFGMNDPTTDEAMELMASISLKLGNVAQARHTLTRVLNNKSSRLGIEHPSTQRCRTKLYDLGEEHGKSIEE